jgi:hypothetical protein
MAKTWHERSFKVQKRNCSVPKAGQEYWKRRETSPGMYTAEYVTAVADGKCAWSIINTKDEEVATELAPAELDAM